MSSPEVLERDVSAIRADLNELKTDFRAAVKRIDERIDAAVSKLENEIRAMGAKAERDLEQFATRIETQLAEMRADDRALRDRLDKNTESIAELGKGLHSVSMRANLLLWFVGVLGTLTLGIVSLGKALN